MHFSKEIRAVSTFLFILVMLVSLIIGGLLAYMWVMSSYYNMPKNSSLLSVENVVFPQDNFNYFNVTILNPSNSGSDLNVTGFDVIVESQNETFSAGTADPAVPFLLKVGSRQGFKILRNWSNLAGQSVRIEPLVSNGSVPSLPFVAPTVKLLVSGFSTTEDTQHFNLTVQNSQESVINLTVTEIRVFDVAVNSTPSQTLLPVGQQQEFRCTYDWANLGGQEITTKVLTDVGFEQVYETSQIQSAYLSISGVQFDNATTDYFNITVESLPSSSILATLTGVNVTLADNTTLALSTIPPLNTELFSVAPNRTQSVTCLWNWSAHRSEPIVVQAFTKEGFSVQDNTTTTPAAVIWSVDDLQFDLDDLQHFSLNITNAPDSLEEINVTEVDLNNVTKVDLNLNVTLMNSVVVAPANSSVVVWGFNWTEFVGRNINVTVHAFYGQNEATISQTLALPYLKVANASFSNFPSGNPYVNVTMFNSKYSLSNATIMGIFVTASNGTRLPDIVGYLAIPKIDSSGYLLSIESDVTFVCPYIDWTPYIGQNLTFRVQTAEGPTFSGTFPVG